MRQGGAILSKVLDQLQEAAKPGVTTKELDQLACELLSSFQAESWFPSVDNFPGAICTSLNNEVVHGAPSDRVLKNGDVLKIDLGVAYQGFNTDGARTMLVGGASDHEKQKLIDVTSQALVVGIEAARAGNTTGDIGHAIETYVKEQGFDVVRDLIGHGIGKNVHEEPEVPNYGKPGSGAMLAPGMTIAIEPMVVQGSWKVALGRDHFSYVTKDGGLAAHEEHTVAITDDKAVILTQE